MIYAQMTLIATTRMNFRFLKGSLINFPFLLTLSHTHAQKKNDHPIMLNHVTNMFAIIFPTNNTKGGDNNNNESHFFCSM